VPTLLVVDDEEALRSALQRYLAREGYRVLTASSGEEAMALLRREAVGVVLLDVNLPGVSGLDLVPRVLELGAAAAIVMLTAVDDASTAALCLERGALDYLLKPVDLDRLGRVVAGAVAGGRPRPAGQSPTGAVPQLPAATLEALVNTIEARDPHLRGHSERVADLSAAVAAQLGCGRARIDAIRTAGRLHDIGKIAVRDDVLHKAGPLTDEEYEHVKRHVVIGSRILAPLAFLEEAAGYVRSHHERWDGFGYPDRLAGEAIPLGARIIGAVEIYDALTTPRSYQERMTPAEALDRMRDLVGTAIDPAVHAALAAAVSRRPADA